MSLHMMRLFNTMTKELAELKAKVADIEARLVVEAKRPVLTLPKKAANGG